MTTRSAFANLQFGDLLITAGSCCPIPGSSASLADREREFETPWIRLDLPAPRVARPPRTLIELSPPLDEAMKP